MWSTMIWVKPQRCYLHTVIILLNPPCFYKQHISLFSLSIWPTYCHHGSLRRPILRVTSTININIAPVLMVDQTSTIILNIAPVSRMQFQTDKWFLSSFTKFTSWTPHQYIPRPLKFPQKFFLMEHALLTKFS